MRIRTIRRGTKGTKEGDWGGQKIVNKKDKKKVVKTPTLKKKVQEKTWQG